MTHVILREGHLWNVSVLQAVRLTNLVAYDYKLSKPLSMH
jgi:hypothetical protein